MAEEDKYYVGPMNEGQAQAWFQLGRDTIEKLEPRDISNLQLAMERNPAAFTDAQRAQVRDVAWKMIENVAKGKYKLDPRETNNFRSILDHAPSTMYMAEKILKLLKMRNRNGSTLSAALKKSLSAKGSASRLKQLSSNLKKVLSIRPII